MNDFYRCHEEHLANESLQTLTPEQRIKMQHDFLKFMVNKNEEEDVGGSGHFALKSRQHELVYLRQVTKQIFPLLLPSNILKCRMIMELLEEIVVHKLLLKGLDILAEPEVMNNILVKIFDAIEHSGDRKALADHNKQVQILKHWCLMNGCIFKSIKSPSLKEIIENNELLHHFIGYMNSTNSVSILQLYLNLSKFLGVII
jgi:sorting nexin-14